MTTRRTSCACSLLSFFPGTRQTISYAFILASLLLGVGETVAVELPAFPGASGGGAISVGGRGGRILQVTNLDNDGAGSLREALEAEGPRIVVFRVGGSIVLTEPIFITHPFLTIAGQSAPGGGIELRGDGENYTMLYVFTHDVIIRYLRLRPGKSMAGPGQQLGKCIHIGSGKTTWLNGQNYPASARVIVDHCSCFWAADENVTVWSKEGCDTGVHHVTISNSLIAEGLDGHSCGAIVGSADGAKLGRTMEQIDFHHNLFANNKRRHPLFKGQSGQIVNNIIYNASRYGIGLAGAVQVDVIGNLFKNVRKPLVFTETNPGAYNIPGEASLYVTANLAGKHGSEWSPISTKKLSCPMRNEGQERAFPIAIDPTTELEAILLPTVGASRRLDADGSWVKVRDAADARIIDEYQKGKGFTPASHEDVGGMPEIAGGIPYPDEDHDGMSDAWERAHGLDPSDPADGSGDEDGDGYTNIEEFLNGSAP